MNNVFNTKEATSEGMMIQKTDKIYFLGNFACFSYHTMSDKENIKHTEVYTSKLLHQTDILN